MTISASSGPLVAFGQAATGDYNPHLGPSAFYAGSAIMDPRAPYTYAPGGVGSAPFYNWGASSQIPVIAYVPSTLAVNNIAASQNPTTGVAMTLVSSTAAGITVGQSITRADTGALVTGLLAIDGAVAPLVFGTGSGSGGPVNLWNPQTALSRAVRVVSAGNDSGATVTIRGYDAYWYPMTQTLTMGNAATVTTTKCFKYIASVTCTGTLSGSGVTVGTTDVFGLPLRADFFNEVEIWWNSTAITANTGFLAADTTNPATAATGDVRGSYATQSASDGTKRLAIYVSPSPNNILLGAAGLVGMTQV